MLSETKKQIVDFLANHVDSSLKNIIDYLGISKQAVSKHLRELIALSLITKKGRPPKVYYSLQIAEEKLNQLEDNLENVYKYPEIEQNFCLIEPSGKVVTGWQGFELWCAKRDYQIEMYIPKYLEILQKYNAFKNQIGLINASDKVRKTYQNECFLDKVFYMEFSALEIFGRTKMYSYLLYAKQSEDTKLMREIINPMKEMVIKLIIQEKIDAVGFVPPTVPRRIQLMREMEKGLNLPLPIVKLEKVRSDILIAQKTLKTPAERVENAVQTFVVTENREFENILLIDDFVGSGATLNFIAKKIKNKFPKTKKIIGFAVAGTPNGILNNSKQFEVMNEA